MVGNIKFLVTEYNPQETFPEITPLEQIPQK